MEGLGEGGNSNADRDSSLGPVVACNLLANPLRKSAGLVAVCGGEENRELLYEQGFRHVDVFFKWYNFCAIIATK